MADYSNVRALVETSARLRLWRSDLGQGDSANPFRPRDIDPPTEDESAIAAWVQDGDEPSGALVTERV
jgi:hypothetical protein